MLNKDRPPPPPALPTCDCCRFWWTTRANSANRRKIAFASEDILEGPLLGKAVTIINKGTCMSQVFFPDFALHSTMEYHTA
jgi:hypothetical protein